MSLMMGGVSTRNVGRFKTLHSLDPKVSKALWLTVESYIHKLYKAFEHLFILKRGDMLHMFGWFFYYIWLTLHDTCDLWTFGGRICLSLQGLARWNSLVVAQSCLDLHRGMETTGWIMRPLSLDTWEDECCLWRHLKTMRWSYSNPLHPNIGFWRPKASSSRP